jgi:extensin-like protein
LNSDKLSEHAKANAIDIAAFVTADGRTIEVARFWGPTARDQREAERLAAEQAERARKEPAKKDSAKPEPAKADAGPNRKPSAIATGATAQEPDRKRASPVQTSELQKLGPGARDAKSEPKAASAPVAAEREAARQSAEGAFLRRLHKGACGTFGTVLGPEANEAHRDHFHFDLAARRRNTYCE